MTSFWDSLKPPIVGLAPMDGVTDQPYRYIQKKYGKPSVMYTEFTSVEGVCRGAKRLLRDFMFDDSQRPIVAQIYGTTPQFFRETATLLCELGFDGIDINMGCPAKNVAHSGAGAALITTPALATDIIKETKAGVEDWYNGKRTKDCSTITPEITKEIEKRAATIHKEPTAPNHHSRIPVSVKTRIGYATPEVEAWMHTLLEQEPAVIALHGRTLKQHYGGTANWEEIRIAVEAAKGSTTKILGNGDCHSHKDALDKISLYGVDGVLIGRASFGNPYVFLPEDAQQSISVFEIALEHSRLYEATYSHLEPYSFMPMRKHLGWYVKSIPHAAEIRAELFQTNSSIEVEEIFSKHKLI